MWTLKNVFSKVAVKPLMTDFLVIAFGGLLAYTIFLGVSYQKFEKEKHVIDSLNQFKIEVLQDSLKTLKTKLDSSENTIRKILSIKQSPVKPAFEMNSLFGSMFESIKASGIKCPEAMLALASHETGRFTSRLSKYHNHFGLAYVNDPLVVDKVWSEGDGHFKSVFASDEDCFRYMAKWQQKKRALAFNSNEDFIKSLKRVNYAASPYHGQIVMQCYRDLFHQRDIQAEMRAEAFKNKLLYASL